MTLTDDDVKWDGELPIVLVSGEDEDNGYACIEQGEGAYGRAIAFMSEGGPWSIDVLDERCAACKRPYWHEAPTGDDKHGWHCPHCNAYVDDLRLTCRPCHDVRKQNVKALYLMPQHVGGDINVPAVWVPVCELHHAAWYYEIPESERLPEFMIDQAADDQYNDERKGQA